MKARARYYSPVDGNGGLWLDDTHFNYRTSETSRGRRLCAANPPTLKLSGRRWRALFEFVALHRGRHWSTYNFIIIRLCVHSPLERGRTGAKSRIGPIRSARVYLKWVRWIGYCQRAALYQSGRCKWEIRFGRRWVCLSARNDIPFPFLPPPSSLRSPARTCRVCTLASPEALTYGAVGPPVVIKTEMIKTCPLPRCSLDPVSYLATIAIPPPPPPLPSTSSPGTCRLNNEINGAHRRRRSEETPCALTLRRGVNKGGFWVSIGPKAFCSFRKGDLI